MVTVLGFLALVFVGFLLIANHPIDDDDRIDHPIRYGLGGAGTAICYILALVDVNWSTGEFAKGVLGATSAAMLLFFIFIVLNNIDHNASKTNPIDNPGESEE